MDEALNIPKITEIMNVPSQEIARWVARTNLVNYALRENHSITRGGSFSDDGQILYELAKNAVKGLDWKTDPKYEDVILYEMKRGINFATITSASEAYLQDSIEGKIGKTALREGLVRIKFLPETTDIDKVISLPMTELTALSFLRANIEEFMDRLLFARKDVIREMSHNIQTAVKPRKVSYKSSTIGNNEKIEVTRSVYNLLSYPIDSKILEKLELDPTGTLSPWWRELTNDLAKIDCQAINIIET